MERIMRFIDGLTFRLQLLMNRKRVSSSTFNEVVDIARQIEMVRGQERVEREAKRPRGQGGFCGAPFRGHSSLRALPAQSSSRAPPVQGFSMPGSSTGYPGTRGSLQFPPPAPGSCFECGEFGHIWRQCPRRLRGLSQQRSQPSTSALVTSLPAQPVWGGGPSTRGRPRGRYRSGGSHACFYALPGRPDAIASDAVVTGFFILVVSFLLREVEMGKKAHMDIDYYLFVILIVDSGNGLHAGSQVLALNELVFILFDNPLTQYD
ncbi:uncharacterized protein [Nicotiana tomentosiformis]|uniref:uncharacterized protein n=1 Tax=Nicotiana tomentosiformis TaxID=4098 RepID=UPI00388C5C15